MEIDVAVIVAFMSMLTALWTAWSTAKKEESVAKISSRSESAKITSDASIQQEQLLSAGIAAHFVRLEEAIENDRVLIADLTERVGLLERERQRMIVWMNFNKLQWPPPEDTPF